MQTFAAIVLCTLIANAYVAADETPLFNAQGQATAYIADDFTIDLWSGKPVAYL